MGIRTHWFAAVSLTLGCSSSGGASNPDPFTSSGGAAPYGGAAAYGGTGSGTGGVAANAGGATAFAGSPGRAGSPNPSGGAPANGGAPFGAGGGLGGFVPAAGGAPSAGGAPTSGGAPSGGASGCVENLGCQLTPPPSTGDIHQDCVDRINQFRAECACLPPLVRWTEGEACADQMAQYDSDNGTAHGGFRANICSGGSAQNECPNYRSTEQVISRCLQQMWDEGPPPQDPCNDACFQEYGHFINMTNSRYTKVACGFSTSGNLWAAQNFSR